MYLTDPVPDDAPEAFRRIGVVYSERARAGEPFPEDDFYDARLVVEIREDGYRIVECLIMGGENMLDLVPVLDWAASCDLDGCPWPPDGWALETCDGPRSKPSFQGLG